MTTRHDPLTRHYRAKDGITGYHEGDILIEDTTDARSLVVRDGRGLVLQPIQNQQQLVRDWLALPVGAMKSVAFAEDDDSWVHDPVDVLREIARTGETALMLCGTSIVIWADRPDWQRQTIH